MTSFGYRLNPRFVIKECSSCGTLYTRDCSCSKGSVKDKILLPKPPKNCARCAKCGHPVNGPYCQGSTLLREKLEEDLVTYFQNFQNTFESFDDSTNVVNAPREPFVVTQDHGVKSSQNLPYINECCCECGDALDGIFCQQCTCKSCGKGAHVGYNCPPKVPIISNSELCNQTMNNEPPQTLPSFDSTCYSKKENSVPCISKPNFVDESSNIFNPPPQPPIYSSGTESRPLMLNKENYVKRRPNGKLIHNSILNGPYVRRMITEPGDGERDTILLGLPEEIYAAVDSCETAQEIWLRNQIRNGNHVAARADGNAAGPNGNQIRCYNCRGFGHYARNCTARPRRKDAVYLQTQLLIAQKEEAGIQLQAKEYDLMVAAADLDKIEEVNANCILMANLLQASSSGTQTDSAPVYDSDGSPEYNQKEVDELKAERLAKIQDPLALMANSNNPYASPAPHQDQSPFNQNFLQQPMINLEDITDPTTAMNMALALMAKAFKLNYSTPTNNNQRISSNPRNMQIAQPGMNMGQDRQMQMIGECRELGCSESQDSECWKLEWLNGCSREWPKRMDAAYLQTQLLIAQKEEAGIQLQAEEYDLMAAAVDLGEIEEVNANCILMANLQQASSSSDGSAE
nr:hypothetical protein [Tanacetum cinerariifolium]